jgi:hypothetical protein
VQAAGGTVVAHKVDNQNRSVSLDESAGPSAGTIPREPKFEVLVDRRVMGEAYNPE